MVTHVVLLQPKPDTTTEQISLAFTHVRTLMDQIPGILSVAVGTNLSSFNKGYSHGFIMQFVDEAHLKQYASHAAHIPVSEELQTLCENIIDFDLLD